MLREAHALTQPCCDDGIFGSGFAVAFAKLRGQLGERGSRVARGERRLQGAGIEVRRVDRSVDAGFVEEHGERIRFLAAAAARGPNAEWGSGAQTRDLGQHESAQRVERSGVAVEAADLDRDATSRCVASAASAQSSSR